MNKKRACMLFVRHGTLDDRIYFKEARTLANAGYDVHILCRLYDGAFTDMMHKPIAYPDANGTFSYEGLTLHGIRKRKGLIGKWLEYRDLVKAGVELNADVYHCHETDIALAAALKIKKIIPAAKLIYDMHEYEPGAWADSAPFKMRFIGYHLFRLWERFAFRSCDYLITANSIVRGYALIANRFKPVEIILNAPILALNNGSFEKKNSDRMVLCHEGSLGFNRGFKEMLALLESFKGRISLKIVGTVSGKEKEWLDEVLKRTPELANVLNITGWLPYEKVCGAINGTDIGLILSLPTINNMLAGPPNKLFNYMSCGIPVVSVNLPEVKSIIERYKCGIVVKDWSPESINAAIESLVSDPSEARAMGERGKTAVLEELSWEKQGEKLLKVYEELFIR